MEDKKKTDQSFTIIASSRVDNLTRALKQGETFAVFDSYGDIRTEGIGEQGIYHEGTRFLSCLELRLEKGRPLLFLSSSVQRANELLAVDLMNHDISVDGQLTIPKGSLHIFRSKFLFMGTCHERLRISNYGLTPVHFDLSFSFDADFSDIFEVRGTVRERKGRRLEDAVEDSRVTLSYEGLDGQVRRTRLECHPRPDETTSSSFLFKVSLQPKQEAMFFMNVTCDSRGGAPPQVFSYQKAFMHASRELTAAKERGCEVATSNTQFNDCLNRSVADILMMLTETPNGIYPYAGVPWFSTPFGRDGIITALQLIWIDSEIARGVLAFLAATQAKEVIPERDAEPGKILHETRKGEMANLGEIPFGRYYGSVDSTPLFIILAGVYYEWTGDRQFIESIWPQIELALAWIKNYGDVDGDGFVEYARRTSEGLVQQGWKDSHDSVFHADGVFAEAPIALCEVQGYVYAAKRKAALLASILGRQPMAEELLREAEHLRERFEQAFWSDDLNTYVIALDGKKRPCKVRASNAGHCLFSGIAGEEHAQRVAQTLMAESSFSGWGIRTLASSEVRYNPMSYHNGSIWPHDNSLIALGLSRYGFTDLALRVFAALFDAALFLDLHRLPELFCGFHRRSSQGPTLYPLACAPQAWASGSLFLLLQSCLGLSGNADKRQLRLTYSQLPEFLPEVHIRNLKVGKASVDLLVKRHTAGDVSVNVLRRDGPVEIVVVK